MVSDNWFAATTVRRDSMKENDSNEFRETTNF